MLYFYVFKSVGLSYRYVHLYLGTDPVFDEEDVFKQTILLDDDYSPEQGKNFPEIYWGAAE